ncbi:hypothetical protein BJY16_004502 [Actinoplanes octamycinicus]|uniref:Lipoprotein LprG n=1 Tax=Actinoplanes octamycinicus TaxID=135948 RepID=A0A7W7GZB9_9ACTN|nr:hypothetical protein [Actinoplanes octamycinicus]MBB4741043.1 hypothetical protein [Actinoplanes octamycinicus]GIE55948.1 lipoprotein [Actinoplanes octamycinicus]
MKAATRVGLAALTITAALLAGCGNGDKPDDSAPAKAAANGVADLAAPAILDKAKAALKAASSFHVKGAMSEDGDVTQIDLKVAGKDLAGSIQMGEAKLQMLSVAGARYIKPNDAFWTMIDSSGATAKLMKQAVGDKWIKPTANDASLGSFFFGESDIDEMLTPGGAVTKGEAKAVDGVPAIGLVDSSDTKTVLYVATSGEPYPIKMERPAPEGLTFSEFNQTFAEIKAPAETDVVDQSKIQKK